LAQGFGGFSLTSLGPIAFGHEARQCMMAGVYDRAKPLPHGQEMKKRKR
jgi:hypothetical protein